jgi:hypothetical protein
MTDYKRLNYYNGQFLNEDDFNDDQAYHRNRQMLHGRMQHFWGIAEGLAVTISNAPRSVDIAPGAALDKDGNQILLDATATQSFQGTGAGTWYLVIQFAEVQSDPAAAKYVPGNTRWTQTPAFVFRSASTLAVGDVVLATLTLTGATNSESLAQNDLSASDRTYAGLRVTGPDGDGYDLRPRSDGSLVLERCPAGDSPLTPLVYVASAGGVGIGAAPPSGKLLAVGPSGQLTVDSSGDLSTSGAVSTTSSLTAGSAGQFAVSSAGAITGAASITTTGSLTAGSSGQFGVSSAGAITAATGIASSGTIHFSGLTGSQAVFTDVSSNLTSTGTVGVAQGGTGATSLTSGSLLQGNGTSAMSAVTAGTANRTARWTSSGAIGTGLLYDDNSTGVGVGAAATGGLFTVGTTNQFKVNSAGAIAAATGIASSGTINFSALTASQAVFTDGSSNLTSTGTVGVAQGGTGATTLTAGSLLQGNGTSAMSAVTAGTANRTARWTSSGAIGTGLLYDDNSTGVGVGAAATGGLFTVGTTNQFKVNSAGAITAAASITTTGSLTAGSSGQFGVSSAGAMTVGTSGTSFARIQGGVITLGASATSSVKTFTINYPTPFTNTPKVIATPRTENSQTYADVFAITVTANTTNHFLANVCRVDTITAWAQILQLDWLAWE